MTLEIVGMLIASIAIGHCAARLGHAMSGERLPSIRSFVIMCLLISIWGFVLWLKI